jgi:ketosteroid isomerase-like protein
MTNEQAILTATDNFYAALNVLFTGNSQSMKDAWSHADDVTYMGPDGLYLIGWTSIEQMWDSVAVLKLGGRVNPQQLHTVIGADMALITCVELGENEFNGKAESVSIRSSTVFHKRSCAWKVIAHQTDLLGYMN